MTRSALLRRLAEAHPGLKAKVVDQIVEIFFQEIVDQIAVGGRVELRGFGVFSARKRPARAGRNPRTGDVITVHSKYATHFRAGKAIQARLNRGHTDDGQDVHSHKMDDTLQNAGERL